VRARESGKKTLLTKPVNKVKGHQTGEGEGQNQLQTIGGGSKRELEIRKERIFSLVGDEKTQGTTAREALRNKCASIHHSHHKKDKGSADERD